jgi:hypothetical protein
MDEPIVIGPAAPPLELSRAAVRHLIVRRRNERIRETRNESWPRLIRLHPDSLTELLVDSDPAEAHTLDFEGLQFMNIPVQTDPELELGVVAVDWPAS